MLQLCFSTDLWQADLLALVETKQRFDALDPHKPGDTELALNLVDEWSAEYANLKSLLQVRQSCA